MRTKIIVTCLVGLSLLIVSDAYAKKENKAATAEQKPTHQPASAATAEGTKHVATSQKKPHAGDTAAAKNGKSSPRAEHSASDPPPADPGRQREWLQTHLLRDMHSLGTFDGNTTTKAWSSIKSLTDDQAGLLCQNYSLSRSKAEQDAYIYSLQQQGYSDEQLQAAKAGVADLLTEMEDQGNACCSQIQTVGGPAQYLAQIEYASVPGWCASEQCYVPDWYYDNGSYVGPYHDAGYCGEWAGPICHAYYDHESSFYKTYHRFDDKFYQRHSAQLALRSARYFHEHDYHRALAHDRFLSPSHRMREAGHHVAPLSRAAEHGKMGEHLAHAKGAEHVTHAKGAEHVTHSKAVAKPASKVHATKKGSTKLASKKRSKAKTATKAHPTHQERKVKAKTQKPANKANKAKSSKASKPHTAKAGKAGKAKPSKPNAAKASKSSPKPAKQSTAKHKH